MNELTNWLRSRTLPDTLPRHPKTLLKFGIWTPKAPSKNGILNDFGPFANMYGRKHQPPEVVRQVVFLMLKALNFQNFAMLMLSSDQSTSYSVKKIGVTMECHRKTGLEFYAQC